MRYSVAQSCLLLVISGLVFAACHSANEKATVPVSVKSTDLKVAKLKIPDGFVAEHLFGASAHDEGSWVAMTFDNKGRLIASDQYGALYRMQLPAIGDTSSAIQVEELTIPSLGKKKDTASKKIDIGYAHGLLYAFNSLYVMINHHSDTAFSKGSGLYRLQDTNGDDQYDKITLLKKLEGEGEHGPHSIVLSPDQKSLFVIAGNFTKIPAMDNRKKPTESKIDNIYPLLKDPNGHDNSVGLQGGWIANVDSTGSHWTLYSSGFRNPFDLAFNEAGDMFTYDSDMEWDIGTPWYRPTRICHVTSGSEFGWRPGSNKWSPVWPDNSPALLNIGQGSPTNVVYAANSHFPEKYRRSLLAFDWSFGIIYSIQLTPEGASYSTHGEEFISGSPLPLTDGLIGPDGALYFLTGGRRLESDLYRVYYADNKQNLEPLKPQLLTAENQLRRQMESYHNAQSPGKLEDIWPVLKHPDRSVRYAALLALEYHPLKEWENKLLAETDPIILTEGAIAYAHLAKPGSQDKVLRLLNTVSIEHLPESSQIDFLRSIELMLSRLGKPSQPVIDLLVAKLDPLYPAKAGNELNRELSKVLLYLGAPDGVGKTMALLETAKDDNSDGQSTLTNSADLIMRNPQYGMDIASTLSKMRPMQQTFYAVLLTQPASGWTNDLRSSYFHWFYETFGYRGGVSYMGFINDARKKALANLPKLDFAHFNALSGDSIVQFAGTAMNKNLYQPKGPGREWTIEEAVKVADSGIAHRNFNKGKGIFVATLCASCHAMRGEGGVAGPDLTQLGSRFSYNDMLTSIIEPNKTISDQFGTTVFTLKNGSSTMGRIISQDAEKYIVSQNPFAPQQTKEIKKAEVSSTRVSEVSPMLAGLINRLNADELKDLLAFLKAGGNAQDTIFATPKK